MEQDIEEKKKLTEQKKKYFKKEILPYIILIFIVIFVRAYIISPVQVNGGSMDHTLRDGDIMLLNKLEYKRHGVKRFDIVVIKSEKDIIKRIIGLPGDSVYVKDNTLYINDKKVDEYYLDKDTVTEDFTLKELLDEEKVPKGKYFVLGDHREVSLDSRYLGFIDEKDIEGIAKITLFPFSRMGIKK